MTVARVPPVAAPTTMVLRRSVFALKARGSNLSGAPRTNAQRSVSITADQTIALIAKNTQNRSANCALCGPWGSRADCHPEQALRARAAGNMHNLLPSFMLARLTAVWLGRFGCLCALEAKAGGFRPGGHKFGR